VKIICAPDSFKEALSAADAAAAMARGIHRARPDAEVDQCPIADGGEGTVAALVTATGGELRANRVTGPCYEPVDATWGMLGGQPTAVIEMAAASGLALVSTPQRNPMRTTTRGTGELIRHAFDAAAQRIILGIGGSATTDGGCGAVAALGVRFFNATGQRIETPTGGSLIDIARIDTSEMDARLRQIEMVIACDVTNPLTGERGAAHVYGPQKGATPEQVQQLDEGLAHLARLWREQLGKDVTDLRGGGAAGGLGAGAVVYFDAHLRPGIELVLEAARFEERVRGAVLCLTGEGRLDGQSLAGKAVLGVARAAARQGVPTIALVGGAADDAEKTLEAGLRAYHVIGPGLSRHESMARTAALLEAAAQRAVHEMR